MIIYVGGAKGGTGKSLVASLGLYYFIKNNRNPVLLETDNNNPDVYKAYHKTVKSYAFNINDEDGWTNMLDEIGNIIEVDKQRPIVINSAAANIDMMHTYGGIFNQLSDEIGAEVVTLWVGNTGLDSLVLLTDFLKIIHQKVCFIKNGFFGKEEKFITFANSKLAQNGLKSVYLDRGTVAVMEKLYDKRIPLNQLDSNLKFGERLMARSWLNKAENTIETAIDIAEIYHPEN